MHHGWKYYQIGESWCSKVRENLQVISSNKVVKRIKIRARKVSRKDWSQTFKGPNYHIKTRLEAIGEKQENQLLECCTKCGDY